MTRRHAHDGERRRPTAARQLEGLALFDQQPIEPPRPERSLDELFADFHAANPHVYREIEARALQLKLLGRRRVGIGAIVEAMRADPVLQSQGDRYKINNNYRSRYARLLIEDHPELVGVIELRELRSA